MLIWTFSLHGEGNTVLDSSIIMEETVRTEGRKMGLGEIHHNK